MSMSGVKVICKRSTCETDQQSNWIFHSSFFTLHFRKMHYVANVPADLRSAGMEYQDLRSDYFRRNIS